MHPAIQISYDHVRGCGFRDTVKALYFRCDGPGVACGVLPLELRPCPTCAAMGLKCSVKPTRGFTWIDPSKLWDWQTIRCAKNNITREIRIDDIEPNRNFGLCPECAMSKISQMTHVGLLWIGEKFYATPQEYDKESNLLGISSRLPHDHLPKGFKIGQDFIMLAHKFAVLAPFTAESMVDYKPGVFRVFRPERVEVICDGTESDEVIQGYLDRNLTPVFIERVQ